MSAKVLLTRKLHNGALVWDGPLNGADDVEKDVLDLVNRLRICPFCKQPLQEVVEEEDLFYVFCSSCCAMGPEHPNLVAALRLWQGETSGEVENA